MENLDTLVQEKMDGDADFQESLSALPEEEKEGALNDKKKEIIEGEVTSLREKAEKAGKNEELANNYKIRAEKAEGDLKKVGKETPTEKTGDDLSSTDVIAIINAKVHKDDIEEVKKAAKLLGKSISEALDDQIVKIIIERQEEFRKSAIATNAKTSRSGSSQVTDKEILDRALKGEIPEQGSEDAERLYWARRGGKR